MTTFKAPLRRSRSKRMIAGVVGGLADYLGIDVTLARVLFVLLSIFSTAFPGAIVYILFWLFTPEEDASQDRLAAEV
jgi:phage shock protein C